MESKIIEIDALNGEVVERNATQEEMDQQQLDKEHFENQILEENSLIEARNTAKESAKLKLSQLGLNEEEINAMLGL